MEAVNKGMNVQEEIMGRGQNRKAGNRGVGPTIRATEVRGGVLPEQKVGRM